MNDTDISPEFPFPSRFIDIFDSQMHYIDEGSGEPVLFLHGNPTSSYLWRNIIPHLSPHARCIAPDLVGMGRSGKPDIEYRFRDHAQYLERFIEKMDLQNITLMVHDWGSGLGFHYARRHPENIKAIAFLEAIIGPARWRDFPLKFKLAFSLFRTPGLGWVLLSAMNLFVEQVLPRATVRSLTDEEMNCYRAPYQTIKDRKPVWIWPQEIPINGRPPDVHRLVTDYNRWLQETPIPKLLFYGHPGGIIRSGQVQWCKNHLKNLETTDLGKGIHYLPEDHPHEIGEKLSDWYDGL